MNDPVERRLEALQPNLAPEEACLSALLDLNAFQEVGPGKAVSDFYTAFTGSQAPEDLRTRISTHPIEQNPQDPPHFSPQTSYVEGFEIAATVVVDFDARDAGVREMLNLDFVMTAEGLQVMRRELFRRFHIGDILSITTGKLTSPRGMDGIYDILGYMTDDSPFTTQLGRFAEECKPYLEKQLGEAIKPFSEVPEGVKDSLSLYKWLHGVTDSMDGDPFLKVGKIGEEDHAVLDPMTELELDHGPEIKKKFIQIDPSSFEQDEE